MIISREYVTFRRLVDSKDPAGQLFMELFHKSYPRERWDEIFEMLQDQCLYQREMGWAFSGIGKLIEGFKELDQSTPYDNGLTLADTTDSEVMWCDENSATIHLVQNAWGVKTIIKVVKIGNK